jgi:hypothetical protein
VYPTLRRRPARIGDAQGGTNCSLSSHSGLPALSVPAGFTADGVPIGMDLLGPAWSDQTLLSLGYSIERTLKLRQPPFSTPPLVNGRAPAARATRVTGSDNSVELSYDETTGRVRFSITVPRKGPAPAAIWWHSGTRDKVGAARHQLFSARAQGGRDRVDGEIVLSFNDRRDLRQGEVSLRFYPGGSGESVTVHLPEMRAWQ